MAEKQSPHIIVLAGPNGAGKSTAAPKLLPQLLGVGEFVNADVIAHGLSAFRPEKQAIEAGRIMLRRLHALAAAREDFVFETTLASRNFAPWIKKQKELGYEFQLAFFYLDSPEAAIDRVAQRTRAGGHFVPEDVIRRRYARGLNNLTELYIPLATTWYVYNNTIFAHPRLIASREADGSEDIQDATTWRHILSFRRGNDEATAND